MFFFSVWYHALCIDLEHYSGSSECLTQVTDFTNKKTETKDTKGDARGCRVGYELIPNRGHPPPNGALFSQHSENRLHRHTIDSNSSSTPSPESTSSSKALRLQCALCCLQGGTYFSLCPTPKISPCVKSPGLLPDY